KVTLLAVDGRFWPDGQAPVGADFWKTAENKVVLNATLARELNVAAGDQVTLYVQKAGQVPRESLLGRRKADDVRDLLTLDVAAIIPDEGLGRFSLNPSVTAPRNAFVPLTYVQSQLDLTGRVNAVLASGETQPLQDGLRRSLDLADWGLVVRSPESRTEELFAKYDRPRPGAIRLTRQFQDRVAESFLRTVTRPGAKVLTKAEALTYYQKHRPYLSLESKQAFLEPAVVEAALKAARDLKLKATPTLVYLADSIEARGRDVPYSIVAAVDPVDPPLGPLVPPGTKDNQIVLSGWIIG